MAEYRVGLLARQQLLDIYAFSDAKFGKYQADAYHAGFERTFDLLANFPRMDVAADELMPDYRRSRFQSHYIFYTEKADHVLIQACEFDSSGT